MSRRVLTKIELQACMSVCVFVCVDAGDDAEKCQTAEKAGVTVHPQALGQTKTS